jgi:hypothetical protein
MIRGIYWQGSCLVSPWNDRSDISKRAFSFTQQCKLALKNNLKEWSTHFWGNSCYAFPGQAIED